MDPEIIEVIVVRPSSVNDRTLARITGANVVFAGFTRNTRQAIFRMEGGTEVLAKLRADGVIVKKIKR